MDLGNLHIDPIVDGVGRFAPTRTFRGTTDDDWSAHRDLLDADGMLQFVMGGFLVRGNGHVTLIDLGLGTGTLMGITGGSFVQNLAACGVEPHEVTDVLFTHLHSDHIGWAVSDGQATFANATLRASQADVDHFVHGSGADENERAVLDVVGTHIVAWDAGSTTTIVPGIDQFAAPGHTPGSSVIVLSSGSERAMLLGDVVHCPVQLIDDEWAGLFDVDPVMARRTRTALARELEGDPTLVAAAHFPDLRMGRLLRGEGRRLWQVA
jgi:glyoxylase-like metal-dependent hydrolase (beta-lactamase superfamily II)